MPRPTTALIVDDEPHARIFVRLLLKELGIETVWEARDGAQAIAHVAANHPELVLLDLNLPIVGGMEVLEYVQRMQPGIPVVIITSHSASKEVQYAIQLGAAGYLLKQSSNADLLASLRELLEARESDKAGEADPEDGIRPGV